jgi:glycosyltransferase involved in cell wall biosynthesis
MPPVETLYHGPNLNALEHTVSSEGVREEFGIAPGVPLIGTVANFKEHKGHEFLLRAAVLVRKVKPEVRFLLVGTGPMEERRRKEAIDLGLDGSVVFAGFRKDALRLVSELDLFVLASLQEGLSIALVEAMALGKPVVATNVGGIPEVIENGREGLIVAPRNPNALAAGILQLLQDESLRTQMGAAARQRADRFDIRSAVRRMEAVYDELLAR